MSVSTPHYLLFSAASAGCQSSDRHADTGADSSGKWEFVLESLDGTKRVKVVDREEAVAGERLELLAVVRGLEALDQPSRVTLMTASHYVLRGLRFGLSQWREDGWQWESFGRMTPIRNADLWRRLDQAMRIHRVRCRTLRVDPPPVQPVIPRPHAIRGAGHASRASRRARGWLAALANWLIARPAAWWAPPSATTRLCAD